MQIFSPCEHSILIMAKDGPIQKEFDSFVQFSNMIESPVKIVTAQQNFTKASYPRYNFRKFLTSTVMSVPRLNEDEADQRKSVPSYRTYVAELNADYVLIFTRSVQNSSRFFSRQKSISASSVFIFVHEKSDFQIFCAPCAEKGTEENASFQPETVKKPEELLRRHRKLHRHMNQAPLDVIGLRGTENDCVRTKINYEGPKNHIFCFLLELSSLFNFTIRHETPGPGEKLQEDELHAMGTVVGDIYWDSELRSFIQGAFFDWVPAGEKFIHYGVLQVNDQTELNVSAIWNPFISDTWLWNLCAVTGLIVTALLFISLKKSSKVETKSHLFSSIFVLVATFLIEKCEVNKGIRRAFTWRSVLLTFLWAQAASLISYAYKGDLFAKFAATTTPSIPLNMEDLSRSKLKLFSSAYYVYGEIDTKYPILNATFEDLKTQGILGENAVHSAVNILKKKFIYLNEPAINMILRSRDKVSGRKRSGSSLKFDWPSEYILVESQSDLLIFLFSMKLSGKDKNKVISLGPQIPFLSQRMPILVQRTFFSNFFQDGVYRIVESGISTQWENRWIFTIGASQLKNLEILAEDLKDLEVLKMLRTKNVYAVLFRPVTDNGRGAAEGSPLPLKILIGIVYVFLTGSTLAILSLLAEIIQGCLKSTRILAFEYCK